jgi:hypothetical protein
MSAEYDHLAPDVEKKRICHPSNAYAAFRRNAGLATLARNSS